MSYSIDGFWLPQAIHDELIPSADFASLSFANGRPCSESDPEAVTARWPKLNLGQWNRLLAALQANRQKAPKGDEFWERLKAALLAAGEHFANPHSALRKQALNALPGYTGYSEAMIRSTLGALDMMSLDAFPSAFALDPTWSASEGWQRMAGLPGRLRFFPSNPLQRALRRLPGASDRLLFGPMDLPDTVVGYGAGNVPGAALLIAFLAQATTLAGGSLPVVIIRNSRNEPIFSPLVLKALETADPGLVSTTAVLVWDYEDASVQNLLLKQANLVVAAASDETIAQIGAQIDAVPPKKAAPRFHAHGHKVSFSAIGKEMLAKDLQDQDSGGMLLDIVALLAALDSIYWDQNGCLSSRIHFIETGEDDYYSPEEYAARLQMQLSLLASYLPRGAWPRQHLHDRFDRYKGLEAAGKMQVLSNYDDEFVLAIDRRPPGATSFFSLVNDCQGRVVIVRPVDDLMDIPQQHLRMLPSRNLQSLSVALGKPGEGLSERVLRFAQACGQRGVTAIRTVGRGAFPQLAYSWDGLIPLDLVRPRSQGHFTTIEFDQPYEEMVATYQMMLQSGAQMGFTPPA